MGADRRVVRTSCFRFADTPIVRPEPCGRRGREADGAPSGLTALADVDPSVPRYEAVAAHLHERNGDLERAARLYAAAARNAPNLAERDHQNRQAARLHELLRRRAGRPYPVRWIVRDGNDELGSSPPIDGSATMVIPLWEPMRTGRSARSCCWTVA